MDEPIFTNQIHLRDDEVVLEGGDGAATLPCEVVLRTEPTPRVVFTVRGANPWLFVQQRSRALRLVHSNIRCQAFISHTKSEPEVVVAFTPTSEPISVGDANQLERVEFDLLNFPTFISIDAGKVRGDADCLDIAVGEWELCVRPKRNSPETTAFRSPLYLPTHFCMVSRKDRSCFTAAAAGDLLDTVHEAFSFAAGRWISPVLVRGFGSDSTCCWEQWGTRLTQPNLGPVETWFDSHHGQAVGEALRGMYQFRGDSARVRVLHSAMYWYLRSSGHAAGVDGGIILLQSALELLSWHVFVTDRRALSADGFVRLPAEDQIRLLVESCGIPPGIPPGLEELLAAAKGSNWHDGPKALASLRNSLVHPRNPRPLPYYDAFRLAAWYVELAILRITGFVGLYSNRTKAQRWVGDVESVPWSDESR